MGELAFIVDQIKRAYQGEAWHGPSLRELLADVSAEKATARPLPGAHNILELVLHIAAWQGAVRRRLEGADVLEPEEGDWPSAGKGPDAWTEALDRLQRSHEELVSRVSTLDESRLGEIIEIKRYSVRFMLNGVIQHNIYHSGQIALLKKAGT
jgi:uncharacterized damage-inducible protein DinB